jgi:hypothetical protein
MLRPLVLLTLLLAAPTPSKDNYRTFPCKTSELASSCIQLHGRLRIVNGTPSVRLWQIGTHHVFGIYSNQFGFKNRYTLLDNEAPELPANLIKLMPNNWTTAYGTVYGDFEACPLEPRIEGNMQAACIASATHIVVPKD